MANDPLMQFKAAQRDTWGSFIPLTTFTIMAAASLVEFADIRPGQSVLDVACGTGIVALTAERRGARVQGIDLTPALLSEARHLATTLAAPVEFREGDVELLPFPDGAFDVVVSQFGHMFAPRPQAAIEQMLRVLKPGGRIAFSTWPPALLMGRLFTLVSEYLPPPAGVAPLAAWGDQDTVRQRLGDGVRQIEFNFDDTTVPALSPRHLAASLEAAVAPVTQVVTRLQDQPARLAHFRDRLDTLIGEYFSRNLVRQTFLMTRALKR
jgi:SAM-dependent methyltransferase